MKATAALVIPVRLDSKRFPNKALANLLGKSIIDHVIDFCKELNFENDLWVATDSQELYSYVNSKHEDTVQLSAIYTAICGTHRVFKFFIRHKQYDWYISIPADEPALDPMVFNQYFANKLLDDHLAFNPEEIHTFYTRFYCKEDLLNPLSCKIVSSKDDYMIYNSRNVIPVNKDGTHLPLIEYKKHVGVFLFSKEIFWKYGEELWEGQNIESLEQNMFMQLDVPVKLHEIHHIGFGVDVPDQITQLERRLKLGFNT